MLAVTGSTGELGGRIASRLSKLGIAQRLIVRDVARAPQIPNAEFAQASSYQDAAAIGKALSGVDTLLFVPAMDLMGVMAQSARQKVPAPAYNRVHQHITLVAAAAAVGVRKVVYISWVGAAEDATFLLARDHYQTEEYIRAVGIPFTFLRMTLYMDKAPLHAAEDGVIRGPAGEGRVAWVTRDDIADAAVAVLKGSGHENKTYDITGPEALTMHETAELLSAATGRKISYQAQTPHEARTLRNSSRMDKWEEERRTYTGRGMSDFELEVWISHYLQIATGEVAAVSDDVSKLTGHPAQSLADYLSKHPESYRHLSNSK